MRFLLMMGLVACADEAASASDWNFGDDDTGKADGGGCVVTGVPVALGLDPFYQQYCSADGLPIVAAASVPKAALVQAARVVSAMLAPMPQVRDAMVAHHVRFAIIGTDEQTTDMPEYRGWAPSANQRGRGWGATIDLPMVSSAEENILCYEHDHWRGENIPIHEFGHTIKNLGLELVDPAFRDRVQAAFAAAMADGKYAGLYAATNAEEYWAEGVQDYLGGHRMTDANDINTRAQLASYDPALYGILDDVFHAVHVPAICPAPAFTSGAWYRIQNVALGAGTSLDDADLRPTGNYSGQMWKLAGLGAGRFRLTNEYLGSGQALDIANDGVFEPQMAVTGNYSGQMWTITPVDRGEYRFVSLFKPDRSLQGGSAPTLAATADVTQQAWTIHR